MKKLIPFVATLLILITLNKVFGQNQAATIVATFQGDKGSFDKEVALKTITFTLKNLDEGSRANFENKAQRYSNYFMIYYPTVRESKTSQIYILTLVNKTEIKMLNRLFVATNINQIEFDGRIMKREEFFQPYMQ